MCCTYIYIYIYVLYRYLKKSSDKIIMEKYGGCCKVSQSNFLIFYHIIFET